MAHGNIALGDLVVEASNGCGARSGDGTPTVVLRLADVDTDGTIATEGLRHVGLTDAERTKYALQDGDLLVFRVHGNRSVTGRVIAYRGPTGYTFCDHFIRLRVDRSRVDPFYLARAFSSSTVRPQVESRIVSTAGQNTISQGSIMPVEVPLPSLPEQRRIVAILDKADAIRRKRQEAMTLTEELLRSTFLEMFGDPVANPMGWPTEPLKKVLSGEMRNGLSPSNTGQHPGNVLTLSAITHGMFDLTQQRTAMFDVSAPPDKFVRRHDLLICRGNGNLELVGAGRFPDGDHGELMFPDTMIGAPVDSSRLLPEYMEYLWNGSSVRLQIEQRARTTNGTYKVNQQMLETIVLLIPPLDMQQRFAQVAQRVNRMRTRWAEGAHDQLYSALAQRAFSGEL